MKESDIVATMTVLYVSEGAGKVVAASNDVQAALEKEVASHKALEQATETSARRQASAAAALEALARKTDPAARALADLEKTYRDVTRALSFDQSPKAIDTANKALEVYRQRLVEAEAQQNLFFGTMSSKTLDKQFNIGGGMPAGSAMHSAEVFQKAEAEAAAVAQEKMATAAMHLKAALNPLAAEEAKQVEWLGLMKQAQQAGLISAEQFAGAQQMSVARLANLSQSLKTAGTAGRVMSGEMTNLGFQLNDVVTGLALGQSPFMIIAQQGGQIVQIFANSKASIADFASSSIAWLKGLYSPMAALITVAVAAAAAIAALAVQYDRLQVSSQKAISGAGARTGTTTTDLNAFVDKNAPSAFSGTTLSQKESRLLGEELTKTGDIVISKLNSMSAAVVGFSNQTGQSMDESVKAFAKMASDPVKALDELAKAFGPFSQGTRTLVEDMVGAGDKTLAWNAILSELGPTAKNTAGNMTTAETAFRGLANALGTTQRATGLEKQLEDVRGKLDAAIESANKFAEQGLAAPPGLSNVIALLSKSFEQLYVRQQAVMGLKVSAVFDDIADKARVATEALIPQIKQLREMELQLNQLKAARDNGSGGPNNSAAITAQENLIEKTRDAQTEAARYNERVKEIGKSWGDVGQATALALQAAQNQLPVIQAVGGAAKMAAQYTADFKNAMDAGKSSTEATALAASNLAASMAQVKAAAQEQLFALQNGLQVSQAWTAASQMRAQQQATYNQLLHDGVDAETAAAVAAAQYADSKAKAVASADKLVQSSQDNLDKIKAQGTGMEAVVDASIAYRDAIQSGATATQAAVISANALEASMLRAAQAAQQMEQSAIDAANGTKNGILSIESAMALGSGGSAFTPSVMPSGPLTFSADPSIHVSYRGGGTGQRLDTGVIVRDMSTVSSPDSIASSFVAHGDYAGAIKAIESLKATAGGVDRQGNPIAGGIDVNSQMSQVDTLTQLLNSQTSDKGAQLTNLQSELAWLNKLPETIARDQKIVSLQQSIDSLKNSTDGLNSTMGDLLSPYYTQDPRTSHIGFRSQGMASGGSFIVPGGYSSNDNMVGQIPLASGEEVTVGRPGGDSKQIIINQTINIQGGADKDDVRRTQYHNGQNLARQLKASAS